MDGMDQKAIRGLAAAVNQRATEIYAGEGDDNAEGADAKDLLRALARLLLMEPLRSAFGSPGDWGYGTPIGAALAECYSSPAAVVGCLEVGRTADTHEVVINHPDLRPDANGVGHIIFSAAEAENLARLLLEQAAGARREAEAGT
jgi:hypothetical protein